ncbi:MAG TPA: glycosyltransferase [Pirellulales bacterium]
MPLRILMTHHFPLDWPASGQNVGQLASQLRRRGHAVRCLVVDRRGHAGDDDSVRRIVCDPDSPVADLKFRLPTFAPDGSHADAGTTSFLALTDDELTAYRDVLREALDDEVADFNPHIVHGQHIWIQGHLALEAGVPYLLTAWGPELEVQARDSRYRRYAQEAAENAGLIIAPDEPAHRAVAEAFGELDHRVVLVPDNGPERLEALYDDVLRTRFGGDFRP